MARKARVSPEALAEAEAKATEDAALLEQLTENPPEPVQPEPPQTPTIADRFVGMTELVHRERLRTRLSESTLVKLFEIAMNYHVWSTQHDEAKAQQGFNPAMYGATSQNEGEGLVGPEPDEIIRAAEEADTVEGIFEEIPAESVPEKAEGE